jgi:hypothetical protein
MSQLFVNICHARAQQQRNNVIATLTLASERTEFCQTRGTRAYLALAAIATVAGIRAIASRELRMTLRFKRGPNELSEC